MKTIALMEINASHDECLLSQLHALRQHDCQLLLIINRTLLERNPVFHKYVDDVLLIEQQECQHNGKQVVKRIWQYLKTHCVETLVLNTAHGKLVRDLCVTALFHPIKYIGIAHVMRAFQVSTTQKIINFKIAKYLTLSEHLLSAKKIPNRIPFDYFYPMRFCHSDMQVAKTKARIVVVGSVDTARKDLEGFLTMIDGVQKDIEFVLLGFCNKQSHAAANFLERVRELKLTKQVRTFERFVDQDEFDAYLRSADAILPLVHPNTPSAQQFFKNQIPGAMIIAFSYKIPLLLHQAYSYIIEMQPAARYYTLDNFKDILPQALAESQHIQKRMQQEVRYDIVAHEKRFAQYVLND